MPAQYLEAVREPEQTVNPLFRLLGVRVVAIGTDRAELELPFRPDFIQGGGVVAGGLLATLADEAMAHVVLANVEPGQKTATIDLGVRYFRPVSRGALRAVGTVVNKGRRIIGVEAEVTDEQARLVCKASASFFIIEAKG